MGISDTTRWGWRWAACPQSSAFGAKGQTHPASASTLPLPVVPCRGQVLPWIVLFKKLWKLFHLQSGDVLQPLLYWLRGRVSPFLVSPSSIRPPYHGPLTRGGSREPLTCVTKSRHLTPLCWLLIRAVATKLHMCSKCQTLVVQAVYWFYLWLLRWEAQVDGSSRKGDGKGTTHRKRKVDKINVPLQRMLAVTLPPLGSACTCPLPHPSSQVPGPPWNLPHLGWREACVFCSLKPQSVREEEQKLIGGGRGRSPWDHTHRKAMIEEGGIKSDKINRKG